MRWYLYALLAGDPGPSPDGVARKPVFVARRQEIRILASLWEPPDPPRPERHALLAHERVVEAAMRSVALLPFRFGAVVDPCACTAFVDRYRPVIFRRLEQVAGHVEVALQIWDHTPGPAADRPPRARQLASQLEADLAPYVAKRLWHLAPTPGLLITLTHLIPQEALGPWIETLAALRTRHPDLQFSATRPRPPYHFASVLEEEERAEPAPSL